MKKLKIRIFGLLVLQKYPSSCLLQAPVLNSYRTRTAELIHPGRIALTCKRSAHVFCLVTVKNSTGHQEMRWKASRGGREEPPSWVQSSTLTDKHAALSVGSRGATASIRGGRQAGLSCLTDVCCSSIYSKQRCREALQGDKISKCIYTQDSLIGTKCYILLLLY